MPIRHRHQSWLHKMAADHPDQVALDLGEHRENCDILTGTEGAGKHWADQLRAPEWDLQRGDGPYNEGDPWVSWNTSVWDSEDLPGWTQELSDITYEGRRAHATARRLRRWDNRLTVTFICTHMPAHIGRLIRIWRTSPQERAWKESLQTLRDMVLRIRRNHPGNRIVLVGDWNLDMHSRWVRRKFRRAFRGTGLQLVPVAGEGGTHHGRLIDWALTDMRSSGAVLPPIDTSDHRGVAFTHRLEE